MSPFLFKRVQPKRAYHVQDLCRERIVVVRCLHEADKVTICLKLVLTV